MIDSGFVVRTPAAMVALIAARTTETSLIQRHERGDFGDLSAEQEERNWQAVADGLPVHSVYRLSSGAEIHVVTDPDAQQTRVSLQGVDLS
ncbi:plasmid related protein [Aquabacterium sp. A7-Y]|uniref:plasmid related protein n=1 Tax=Aquabacterium sp. A7-Y TaxID=1349605 RepID=UPI00223E3DBE|nr:plasmid related protein [Aquabacterium sp. A7-Y]MCW7540270.1 plasmid related protein [Aquabacterium sp. A7-Y]